MKVGLQVVHNYPLYTITTSAAHKSFLASMNYRLLYLILRLVSLCCMVCFDIVYQIKQRAGKEKYTPTAEIVNETVLKFNKAAEAIPGKADRSNLKRMVQQICSLQVPNQPKTADFDVSYKGLTLVFSYKTEQ